MILADDAYPENPKFNVRAYNEMNRQERKTEIKIQRNEVSYGSDSPIWATINEHGERVALHEWFVRLPSDQQSALVNQAQNFWFALVAKREKQKKGTPEYDRLTRAMKEQNTKVELLQNYLCNPYTPE